MRIHCFQHVPFERLGTIADWAQSKGHTLTVTQFYRGDIPPALAEIDWLIILGGPMGVHEESQYSWLTAEKRFIDRAIRQGCKGLGICLGAQLLADVLGAKIFSNGHKEIGWYPVTLTKAGLSSTVFQGFPSQFVAFHWHGDTFDLPSGALRLAESAACQNQAFIYEARVVGLQFHLELKRTDVQRLIRNCGEELTESPYIQTTAQMLAQLVNFTENRERLYQLLDRLAAI